MGEQISKENGVSKTGKGKVTWLEGVGQAFWDTRALALSPPRGSCVGCPQLAPINVPFSVLSPESHRLASFAAPG